MSLLAFAVRDHRVNRDRLVKIALVHDLAEAIVGDITPHDGVKKEDKRALEEVERPVPFAMLSFSTFGNNSYFPRHRKPWRP